MADQTDRNRRLEQYRRLGGRDLASTEPRERALPGVAAERARLGELPRHPGSAEPVVALHESLVLGDHRARKPVARAGKAAHEAETVGEHELRLLRGDRGAFGIADFFRHGESRGLTALGEIDRLLGGDRPGMEEIQLRLLARKELGVRQPGAIVLGSVARDRHGRIDGPLERRAKNPKCSYARAARAGVRRNTLTPMARSRLCSMVSACPCAP